MDKEELKEWLSSKYMKFKKIAVWGMICIAMIIIYYRYGFVSAIISQIIITSCVFTNFLLTKYKKDIDIKVVEETSYTSISGSGNPLTEYVKKEAGEIDPNDVSLTFCITLTNNGLITAFCDAISIEGSSGIPIIMFERSDDGDKIEPQQEVSFYNRKDIRYHNDIRVNLYRQVIPSYKNSKGKSSISGRHRSCKQWSFKYKSIKDVVKYIEEGIKKYDEEKKEYE